MSTTASFSTTTDRVTAMKSNDNLPHPGAYRFTVEEKFNGSRLDQYLAEVSELFSHTIIKRIIELGGAHLAGRRVSRCSQTVATGEPIEVFVDRQPLEAMKLDLSRIIYRDKDLIVIDKPAGMATQPAPSRYQGTLYAELQNLLKEPHQKDHRPTIGMVQRLDLDTSGVMVFSIHKRAHKNMTEAFSGRDVGKLYWALVAGQPENASGRFSSQLAKRRSTNLMVSVERGGKQAETLYRLLQPLDVASLVEIELLTGRSHQIRAHFSEAGMPLLGDTAYGGPQIINDLFVPRQMLHSRELSFVHPVTGEKMNFIASPPDDFVSVLKHVDGSLNGIDV